jgi:hypothetical protein
MKIVDLITAPFDQETQDNLRLKRFLEDDSSDEKFEIEFSRCTLNTKQMLEELQPVEEEIAKPAHMRQKKNSGKIPAETVVLNDVPDLTPFEHSKLVLSSLIINLPDGVNVNSPLDIFLLFFSDEVLNIIVSNTNGYAEEKRANQAELRVNPRPWTDLTLEELKVWIAIVIYRGIHKESELKLCWNLDTNLPIHRTSRMMILVRYEQIKRFIHISSPSQEKVV